MAEVCLCVSRELALCEKEVGPIEFTIDQCLGCRGCRNLSDIIDEIVDCEAIITCGEEWLDDNCQRVHFRVTGVICYEDTEGDAVFANNFCIEDYCDEFIKCDDTVVSGDELEELLKFVDGSCLAVDLDCVWNDVESAAVITGTITDKLWKYDNIRVEAIEPLLDDDVAVIPDKFNDCHSRLGPCSCNGNVI